ncbi:LysR substrate-binding domain-containing protein [Cohaesibacter celericrescens]|uniref:LysR family transcriptional regulator n=1 Tax=Cohaesibacter celericrescens TaxID=2067669 RepID=A0A2N5XNR8_9HYPH|nr:LysR substrate-binding domain-containing protein [Cohaesibacter celericrescens]PLW76142.1 LysR family transcriptional regulator [Cohaesibacter celericrescens]
MSPSLRQLTFLVALADELHFSNAAKRCNVTQSTLSAGLKELETILGVSLAERSKRTVIMTPLGKKIVERARHLLADANELVQLAAQASEPMSGDLHMGVIPTVGPFLLPRLRPMLKEQFPNLRLFLREELTDQLIDGLRTGRLDVALIALPHDTGELEALELFEDGYHLVVPMGHPLANQSQTDGQGLKGQPLMLLEKGHCLQQHALSAFPGLIGKNDDFDATSLPTLLGMVEEGLGSTLIPDLAIDAGLTHGHKVVEIALPKSLPRKIALVWRKSSARKEDLLVLAEYLGKARQNLADLAQ